MQWRGSAISEMPGQARCDKPRRGYRTAAPVTLLLSNATSNPSSSAKLPHPIQSQGEENTPAKENDGIDWRYPLNTLGSDPEDLAKRNTVRQTSPADSIHHTHFGSSSASGFNAGFGATAMR